MTENAAGLCQSGPAVWGGCDSSALFEPAPRRGEMGQQRLDVGLRQVAAQPPGSPLAIADKLAAVGPRIAGIGAHAGGAQGPRRHHPPDADGMGGACGVRAARRRFVLGDGDLDAVDHTRDPRAPAGGGASLEPLRQRCQRRALAGRERRMQHESMLPGKVLHAAQTPALAQHSGCQHADDRRHNPQPIRYHSHHRSDALPAYRRSKFKSRQNKLHAEHFQPFIQPSNQPTNHSFIHPTIQPSNLLLSARNRRFHRRRVGLPARRPYSCTCWPNPQARPSAFTAAVSVAQPSLPCSKPYLAQPQCHCSTTRIHSNPFHHPRIRHTPQDRL